eukprot:768502-Hanusia_phi.AAC.2
MSGGTSGLTSMKQEDGDGLDLPVRTLFLRTGSSALWKFRRFAVKCAASQGLCPDAGEQRREDSTTTGGPPNKRSFRRRSMKTGEAGSFHDATDWRSSSPTQRTGCRSEDDVTCLDAGAQYCSLREVIDSGFPNVCFRCTSLAHIDMQAGRQGNQDFFRSNLAHRAEDVQYGEEELVCFKV